MEILWNPWRYEYIKQFTVKKEQEECLFCRLQKQDDNEALIIYRGKHSFIVLNAYPYNSGHLMIAPYRHVPDITELNSEELFEMGEITKKSIRVLRYAFMPDGFNIGANIGRAAGAGVPGHFHIHIVPRWIGDTNFMAIIAGVKTIPVALRETYELIKKAWIEVE